MTNLVDLRLQDNMFEGDIDVIFRGIDNLRTSSYLWFLCNSFPQNLKFLFDFHSASFFTQIPSILAKIDFMVNLEVTSLISRFLVSRHLLWGNCGPNELGLTIALKNHTENVELSRNMLSGSLPPELFQISNLSKCQIKGVFNTGTSKFSLPPSFACIQTAQRKFGLDRQFRYRWVHSFRNWIAT